MKTAANKSKLQTKENPYDSFQGIWEYPQTGTAIDETSDVFRVYLVAPGLEKDELMVNLDEGLLEIEAIKIETENPMDASDISVFFRTLNLPKNVNASQGRAVYEDDVLRITIPKRHKFIVDKRTRIPVK